jgi:hypothetical protein
MSLNVGLDFSSANMCDWKELVAKVKEANNTKDATTMDGISRPVPTACHSGLSIHLGTIFNVSLSGNWFRFKQNEKSTVQPNVRKGMN